jgi:hypothetical protein
VRFLTLALISATAAAEPKLVEDAALGIDVTKDHPVLSDKHAAAVAACKPDGATAGALAWIQLDRAGRVVAAKVHGSGKPAVDACLEAALKKAGPAAKLPGPIILAGHIELDKLPPPRQSPTAVIVEPHGAPWQLTIQKLAYTANRAADLALALDAISEPLAACAAKRGASAQPAQGIAWLGGKPIVQTGTPAYDGCVAKALESIKLPAPESAAWLVLAITAPTEPLAAHTDDPKKAGRLSKDQALRDALTTAVRARKALLRTCLDKTANATLAKVGVSLAAGKATIATVSTGDADADACVKKRFGEVAIPSADAADKLVLDVKLEATE